MKNICTMCNNELDEIRYNGNPHYHKKCFLGYLTRRRAERIAIRNERPDNFSVYINNFLNTLDTNSLTLCNINDLITNYELANLSVNVSGDENLNMSKQLDYMIKFLRAKKYPRK